MSRRTAGSPRGCCERGITLVEMLVAMLILGVLFAAAASALISFSQGSVNNERRVQATALLNRLHEELQALHWDDAVLYSDEVAAMPALEGLDTNGTPSFEGEELVLLSGPGCDVSEPDCRIDTIPTPHEDLPPIDGREYEVYRIVTWADRDGAAPEDLKRFTTIVRWQVMGRTVEQRFDSERAPTPGELVVGNPSVQFLVSPSEIELDGDGRNSVPIQLTADFSLLGSIDSAEVRFYGVSGGAEVEESVTLSQQPGLSERFRTTISAGQFEFPLGPQTFLVVGQGATHEYTSTATVTFVDEGELEGDGNPPLIHNVQLNRSSVTVGRIPPNNNRICHTLTLTAFVQNARPGVTVTANYLAESGPASVSMAGPAVINETGTNTFTTTFAYGSDSPWRPVSGTPKTDVFQVVAQNADSGPSSPRDSTPVTFTYSTKNNQQC